MKCEICHLDPCETPGFCEFSRQVDRRRGGNGHAPNAFAPTDPAEIPPRPWIWGYHYLRGAVTCTVAPGGYGKSALALYEALMMVGAGRTVWYLTGEEDITEVQRRLAALAKLHGIDLHALAGRLYIDDMDSYPLLVASQPRPGSVLFADKQLEQLTAHVTALAIDQVVLDPWSAFHTCEENANAIIGPVIYRLRSSAKQANCGIELAAHTRKPPPGGKNGASLSIDDARGASALVNACRSGRVINRMTATEAELARIQSTDCYRHIRVDNAKRNYAPPENAAWFKLNSVVLDNADSVQAIAKFEFPTVLAGTPPDILDFVLGLLRHKPYRTSSQSPDWLGVPIAAKLGLRLDGGDVSAVCARINRMLTIWLRNRQIEKRQLKGADRHPAPHYTLPDHKPDLHLIDDDEPAGPDD